MFEFAKLGDRVFDYLRQDWGEVVAIDSSLYIHYPLIVSFNNESRSYTFDGRESIDCVAQTLFWDEAPLIVPPKKPLPALELDTKVLVWDSFEDYKRKRHFSHFDEHGRLWVFEGGRTSWSTDDVVGYKNWELVED